jgi:hypothetical protein
MTPFSLWPLGSQDLALLCGARGATPSLSRRECTLTMALPRQPVATHGNGFGLLL